MATTVTRGTKNKKASTNSMLAPVAACTLAALLLHITGIGCPIKFVTGISCPGCGMTRAWLSALGGRLDLALAYHPLFWIVPPAFALAALRNRVPHRALTVALTIIAIALLIVWLLRLALHVESNVLFSNLLTEDVVSIDAPGWFLLVRSLVA